MNTKHTPTLRHAFDKLFVEYDPGDNREIAMFPPQIRKKYQQEIVRRWNTHDELVAALEQVAGIAAAGVIHRMETGKPTWSAFDETIKIARAALEKARGEAK